MRYVRLSRYLRYTDRTPARGNGSFIAPVKNKEKKPITEFLDVRPAIEFYTTGDYGKVK